MRDCSADRAIFALVPTPTRPDLPAKSSSHVHSPCPSFTASQRFFCSPWWRRASSPPRASPPKRRWQPVFGPTVTRVSVYSDSQATSPVRPCGPRTASSAMRAKDVTGADFRTKWAGQPLFTLFEQIRTTMPDGNPGRCRRGVCRGPGLHLQVERAGSGGGAVQADSVGAVGGQAGCRRRRPCHNARSPSLGRSFKRGQAPVTMPGPCYYDSRQNAPRESLRRSCPSLETVRTAPASQCATVTCDTRRPMRGCLSSPPRYQHGGPASWLRGACAAAFPIKAYRERPLPCTAVA
jgi:hypothetical protein